MVVTTDEFVGLAVSEAQALGLPSLPLVVVPHPIGGILPEAARAKAGDIIDEISHILTTEAGTLAHEMLTRSLPKPKKVFKAKHLFG